MGWFKAPPPLYKICVYLKQEAEKQKIAELKALHERRQQEKLKAEIAKQKAASDESALAVKSYKIF